MTLDRAHVSIRSQPCGGGYHRDAVRPQLGEVQREYAQDAVWLA